LEITKAYIKRAVLFFPLFNSLSLKMLDNLL